MLYKFVCIFVRFSWCDTLVHDRNWRTFLFSMKDPFCENKDPFGPLEFSMKIPSVKKEVHWTTSFSRKVLRVESIGSIGPPPVSTKVPSKKRWRPIGRTSIFHKGPFVWRRETHWTTCVFHEGPFCENGDPLDNLGFPRRSFLWAPFPPPRALSNNKGKKAQNWC